MAAETYELIALGMRYWFVLLGIIIVVRAARWAIRDYKHQERVLRALPDAGLIGEVVNLDTGESYPLPREGSLGSARSCDVCLKGIRKRELEFSLDEGQGVILFPSHRRNQAVLDGEAIPRKAWALHGSHLSLPGYHLRFRLFSGLDIPVAATTSYSTGAQAEQEQTFDMEDMSVLSEMGPLLYPDPQPPSQDAFVDPQLPVYPQQQQQNADPQITWAYAVPPPEWFEEQVQLSGFAEEQHSEEQPRSRRSRKRRSRHDA